MILVIILFIILLDVGTNSVGGLYPIGIMLQVTDMALNDSEEPADADDDLIEIDKLLDDDAFMSIAFE